MTENENSAASRRSRSASGVLALLLPLLGACGGGDDQRLDAALVHTVQRGDLSITVRERGELHAAKDTRVVSELEGRNTLIYLIPEGSVAATGDKLAELDVSAIEEKLTSEAISVAKAEAALEQARKNFEIMEKQLEAAEKSAESKLHLAKMRLEKLLGQPRGERAGSGSGTNAQMVENLNELLEGEVEGDGVAQYAQLLENVVELLGSEKNLQLQMGELSNQVLQQINEISLARSELELAEETLGHSRRLADKGFITKNELDRDVISFERQLSQTTLAWNNLELLIAYTLPETLITAQQEIENSELELESVRAANGAARVREAAELKSSEAEFALAQERLAEWEQQISEAVIFAPNPGLVVYGRYDWDEPVYEGMEVRERQEIIILPDITKMVADLDVHEAQIDQVAAGQRVRVEVDAFPGQAFDAVVSKVSTLPKSTRRSDVKLYEVQVALEVDNTSGSLRPGMSASIQIDVGTLPGVLAIPQPALDRQGDDQYVWLATSDGPVARRVELGANNLTHVVVTAGLEAGDRIWLVRPPGAELPKEDGSAIDAGSGGTLPPEDGAGDGAGEGAGDGAAEEVLSANATQDAGAVGTDS